MRCSSPISIKDPRDSLGSSRIEVPCGKCGQCKANRRIQWSFRIAEEFRIAKSAYFITLTYRPEMLPRNQNGRPTLSKQDLTLFFKRIRKQNKKYTDVKFTYYAVGEYGSRTFRPHYHVIAFNLDMRLVRNLQTFWYKDDVPLGIVDVRPVNGGRIHYVTKYHVNVDKERSKGFGVEPEFTRMSKGIGKDYIKRAYKWHKNGNKFYVINNGFKQLLPRYFKEKIFSDMNPITKDILMAGVIKDSDTRYAKEVERLMREGYREPTHEIDHRNIKESERILKDSKNRDIL